MRLARTGCRVTGPAWAVCRRWISPSATSAHETAALLLDRAAYLAHVGGAHRLGRIAPGRTDVAQNLGLLDVGQGAGKTRHGRRRGMAGRFGWAAAFDHE